MFQNLRRILNEGQTLKVRCETCGRQKEWSRREAYFAFGEDAAPYDIRKRAKCSACKRPTELKVWI